MPIQVLIVDDSLFMRKLISDILTSDPEIEVVATAKNGFEAVSQIRQKHPDCITLDLIMPKWDGVSVLKHIMAEHPTPVVILSAYSKKNADITIQCLDAGAVGFVAKPSGELSLDIESIRGQLIEEVKAAAKLSFPQIASIISEKPATLAGKFAGTEKVIVIGASTGGPQTIGLILPSLPGNFPAPIIVAQHVPSRFFTESMAEHLDAKCRLPVSVPEDNEVVRGGRVYFIPSGSQMWIRPRQSGQSQGNVRKIDLVFDLSQAEHSEVSPSVDAIMKSVAAAYGDSAVGVVLSGIGRDGVQGARAIKEAGGQTIVQDESSLIFGMPKAVIDAGYADKVLSAKEIAQALTDVVSSKHQARRLHQALRPGMVSCL